MKKKIHLVAGARPNIIKIAPLIKVFKNEKIFEFKFIYTGQHYDKNLFQDIVKTLGIQMPDINLNIGKGSPNLQISKIIKKYDEYLNKTSPDLVIVFGDVNSTLAASIAAKKNNIKLAHVEAGLRCYDDNLPEETNRRITDSISDILFTPSIYENENLKKENITKNIYLVGNIMIDSLTNFISQNQNVKPKYGKFDGILTLHRPENVDVKIQLKRILEEIKKWTKKYNILFPMHPRTYKNFTKYKLINSLKKLENLKICNPLNYNDFLLQVTHSDFVITDSGGIQEETSYLGIKCFTIRRNTERPITITNGTNQLVKVDQIMSKLKVSKKNEVKIPKWDGKTSSRILKILKRKLFN